MNFTDNQLPSFDWEWGFLFVLASMIAIAGGLLYYFHRRRWI
jgi:Mg2+ and Co2+ transporter CorA